MATQNTPFTWHHRRHSAIRQYSLHHTALSTVQCEIDCQLALRPRTRSSPQRLQIGRQLLYARHLTKRSQPSRPARQSNRHGEVIAPSTPTIDVFVPIDGGHPIDAGSETGEVEAAGRVFEGGADF